MRSSETLLDEIAQHFEGLAPSVEDGKGVLKRLRRDGFVFDVLETPDGDVQLVELNMFGPLSGCGSCLFEWITNSEVLYGEKEGVVLRVVQ